MIIALHISLAILFLTIGTAAAPTVATEIRCPVYNGSNIEDIITMDSGNITIDAGQFAAFFYDIDDNVTTETLSIKNVTEELRYYPYVEKTAGNVTT